MRTRPIAAAFALALLASAALGAAEPRRTWIDEVRFHALHNLRLVGRNIESLATSVRRTMTGLKDDTAKTFTDITREGRRGVAAAGKALSQTSESAYRATHRTFSSIAREVTPGVGTRPEGVTPVGLAREVQSPILAPHFLRGHDILVAWHVDTGGRPVRVSHTLDDRLLLETTDSNLYSFEPRTGVLQWLYGLPAPSQSGYSADDSNIFLIVKDVYYEIDRMIGRPRRRNVLPFPASNPPTVLTKVFLVNSWERRVYALDRETRNREWAYVPEDNILGATPVSGEFLYAADVSGKLVAYSLVEKKPKWTYKAHDAFRVSPVILGDDVILPADDLFVHCVNRFGGLCRWKLPVQGPVTQPVWGEDDVVYFSANGDAFYAVSHKEGKLLWKCPNGGWPVAIGRENIYIQGAGREVWCLDRKTGQKRWAVPAQPFVHFVRNTVNDHIYLATDRGEVYALYLRGDHIEKKAQPPEKKPKAKVGEEHEPGAEPGPTEPSEPGAAPAVKRAEEAPKEAAPEPKAKAKGDEDEAPPAAEKKGDNDQAPPAKKEAPAWKSKAPEGEKPPGELEEEEEKAKGKGPDAPEKKAAEEEEK